jgi:hypothetical protein
MVLSISLFFKLACDRMLFLFAGKETDERASGGPTRRGCSYSPPAASPPSLYCSTTQRLLIVNVWHADIV